MLVTTETGFRVPDEIVTATAAVLEAVSHAISLITCGGWNPEAFLTLADSRKVLRHNYYSSASAARELGVRPVTLPVDAAREMLRAAVAAGYSGLVRPPPRRVWVAVLGGLFLTALLASDAVGVLSLTLQGTCSVLTGSSDFADHSTLAGSYVHGFFGCGRDVIEAAATPAGRLLMGIFIAACACHLLQGVLAAVLAFRYRQAALLWGVQCALLGFPSTELLVARCLGRRAAVLTPFLCVGLFLACLASWCHVCM